MKSALILLAICAFTVAMVPRERRALNTEELLRTPSSTTTSKPKEICAPQTACAWSTYTPGSKFIELNITNDYCICGPGTECQQNEDDSNANAYIYRCRPLSEAEDNAEATAES